MKLTTREGNEIHKFDSVAQYNGFLNKDLAKLVEVTDSSFLGREFDSFDEVQTALDEVWKEGIEIVDMFTERLRKIEFPAIKEVKAKKSFNSEDGEIDFERMLAGNPNYFLKVDREKTEGPTTVTIVTDMSGSGWVDAMDMLWRGAAAIAMTYLLEEKGYQVELWVCKGSQFMVEHPDRCIFQTVQLKGCGDPLDLGTLTSAVSAWFYRTETFLMAHTIADLEGKTVKGTYGRPVSPTEADLDLITTDQKRIYSTGVFSFDGACQLMEAELKRIADEE